MLICPPLNAMERVARGEGAESNTVVLTYLPFRSNVPRRSENVVEAPVVKSSCKRTTYGATDDTRTELWLQMTPAEVTVITLPSRRPSNPTVLTALPVNVSAALSAIFPRIAFAPVDWISVQSIVSALVSVEAVRPPKAQPYCIAIVVPAPIPVSSSTTTSCPSGKLFVDTAPPLVSAQASSPQLPPAGLFQ